MLKMLVFMAYLISPSLGTAASPSRFVLTSPAFTSGAMIPKTYTCHGKNISIPLHWSHIPRGTKSLALMMSDPDAMLQPPPFYHWAIYNIPTTITSLNTNSPLTAPIQRAKNNFGNMKYQGPCPPQGEHRYLIQLYALDTVLRASKPITAPKLRETIRRHMIAMTEMIGRSHALTLIGVPAH